MHTLISLPDDVLILIFQYLQIPDIFSVCQSSRQFSPIVTSYSKAIVPFVARNTFPNAGLLLRVPDSATYTFSWLKNLVPKFLAAVLVDRYRLASHRIVDDEYGIPAESEKGDSMRRKIVNGLHVFKRLSEISKQVHRLPDKAIPQPPLKQRVKWALRHKSLSSRDPIDLLERRERLVSERRLAYLTALEWQHVKNYTLMRELLWGLIYYPGVDRITWSPEYFDWNSRPHVPDIHVRHDNSWVNWFFLHEGPMILWRQWWGGCWNRSLSNYVGDWMWASFQQRTERQVVIERDGAVALESTIRELAKHNAPRSPSTGWFTYDSSEDLQNYHDYRWLVGITAYGRDDVRGSNNPPETLDDVPYSIDVTDRRK